MPLPVRHFCRHADALAQRGVQVNGFADVHSVCVHFNGEGNLGSKNTALRDINELLERCVVMRYEPSGRSTSHEIQLTRTDGKKAL